MDSVYETMISKIRPCVFCGKDPKVSLLLMERGNLKVECACDCKEAFIAYSSTRTIENDAPIFVDNWNLRSYP